MVIRPIHCKICGNYLASAHGNRHTAVKVAHIKDKHPDLVPELHEMETRVREIEAQYREKAGISMPSIGGWFA